VEEPIYHVVKAPARNSLTRTDCEVGRVEQTRFCLRIGEREFKSISECVEYTGSLVPALLGSEKFEVKVFSRPHAHTINADRKGSSLQHEKRL
jgi:hypothetical protein